ncbi:hypothetical protein BC828DRAFT_385420 [Blastocladiella britannica]|nr:hypothetical protein BC828DRAFT_385420 [Blastocladiella britannica]
MTTMDVDHDAPADVFLTRAYELEEAAERTPDFARAADTYRAAINAYDGAFAVSGDPDCLYNAARIYLVLAAKVASSGGSNTEFQMQYLDAAIDAGTRCAAAVASAPATSSAENNNDLDDAHFNLAQSYLTKAECLASAVENHPSSGAEQCLAHADAVLTPLAVRQRETVSASSAAAAPTLAAAAATSLIETLLLHAQVHELALVVSTDPTANVEIAQHLVQEAIALAARLRPPSPAPATLDLTASAGSGDPDHPYIDCLLRAASLQEAVGDRHVRDTNLGQALAAYDASLQHLAGIAPFLGPHAAVHVASSCDAGDVHFSIFEALSTLSDGSLEQLLSAWQSLGRAAKCYADALRRAPANPRIALHLAETEWNRAAVAPRVDKPSLQPQLLKNAAIYAQRALAPAHLDPGDRQDAFDILCGALEGLGLVDDLARAKAVGPHLSPAS